MNNLSDFPLQVAISIPINHATTCTQTAICHVPLYTKYCQIGQVSCKCGKEKYIKRKTKGLVLCAEHCLWHQHSIRAPIWTWAAPLLPSSLTVSVYLGKQEKTVQVLGPLPTMWETQKELLPSGNWTSGCKISLSLCNCLLCKIHTFLIKTY